jgi:hypothetical protein
LTEIHSTLSQQGDAEKPFFKRGYSVSVNVEDIDDAKLF